MQQTSCSPVNDHFQESKVELHTLPQPSKPIYVIQNHHPHYGFGKPKYNCSVQEVVESAEVCIPAFETVCAPVELAIKKIVDKEQCYTVTRTVCSESTEEIENEICTYSYQQKKEDTNAKTVEVTFKRECNTQMVTVCQPTPGYGYHSYGHNYCKEVAQETCNNTPVVTPNEPTVVVAYPEPVKECVNKPISQTQNTCKVISSEECVTVPEVEEDIEAVEKCITKLADPTCHTSQLNLPKQACKEIVYRNGHHSPPPYH